MEKATNLVQMADVESQNAASVGIASGSQSSHLSTLNAENKVSKTTERCPDQVSVQNNSSSEVVTPVNKSNNTQRQEAKSSRPQHKNGMQAPATDTENGANTKKTRQRLRKGKWTIEEEEYTSRIIQYFSTGLLTLPDGATLRSYLAEKLNCDPMRITKKFTGACCLGRRAYHLRDRPRASPAEIEMASFELLHLEQRFRLRVEHEQTGLPLPPRHELLASQPTPTAAVVPSLFTLQQGSPAMNGANHWMQNSVIAPSPGHPSLLPGLTGIIPNTPAPGGANANLNLQNSSSLLLAAGQLLLQNPTERAKASNSTSPTATPMVATTSLQMLNNLVASYALSRAISQQQAGMPVLQPGSSTSISSAASQLSNPGTLPPTNTLNFNIPSITSGTSKEPILGNTKESSENAQTYREQQVEKNGSSTSTPQVSKKEEHTKKLKAAFEEQQRALRMAYEKSLKDAQEREEQSFISEKTDADSCSKGKEQKTDANTTSSISKTLNDTISPAEQLQRSYEAHLASLQRAEQLATSKPLSKPLSTAPLKIEPASSTDAGGNINGGTKIEGRGDSTQKKTQDEEAGAILFGFLKSLRESFEDAVEAKGGKQERDNRSIDNAISKLVTSDDPDPESVRTLHLESSATMTNVIAERHNSNSIDQPDALLNRRRQDSNPITSLSHFQSSKRKGKPASVTETSSSTSSQPTIEQPSSSQEDSSKSDKMGNSSSEESEREITTTRSKGPPRKRLKGFHEPHEFTRENLMAHSKRMDMECGQSGDASSSDD